MAVSPPRRVRQLTGPCWTCRRGGRPGRKGLLRLDVAAQVHQGLDGFGHEGGRLARVREGVRPRAHGCGARGALGIDLRLDDARVAVVDRTHHGHGPAVLARVAQEELARSSNAGCLAHGLAFTAACATVARSAKPFMRKTRSPGRRKTSSAGSGRTPSFFASGWACASVRTLSGTKPAFASFAPASASPSDAESTSACGS